LANCVVDCWSADCALGNNIRIRHLAKTFGRQLI